MKVYKSGFLLTALLMSAEGADSLADAFKEGKFNGELRSYYFNQKTGDEKADILSLAVRLGYATDFYHGFKAAVTLQSSNSPLADKDAKKMFGAANGMYGPGAVLSESYISYTLSKSTLKTGRQFINMPLMRGGPGKAIIQSYEGVTLKIDEFPHTSIYAAYIEKFQKQTDGRGGAPKFEKLSGDYGYALAVVNNYFDKLSLTGAYGGVKDDFSILYMDADFKNSFSDFTYQAAAQYQHTDYKSSAPSNSNYYGIKVGAGFADFNAYLALAQIKDGNSPQSGVVGGGNVCTLFTSSYEHCAEYDKSKQYAIDANYNFRQLKLLAGVRYADMDYEDIDEKRDWKSIYAVYFFSGALDGLFIRALYENQNSKTNGKDEDLYIVRAAYNF
ncbi:MAG: OprD family outer membrane porin [Campylobacteraceae bacterium]|nr:OprD family outer membrane porin [Campylobacteraceae bacterium]